MKNELANKVIDKLEWNVQLSLDFQPIPGLSDRQFRQSSWPQQSPSVPAESSLLYTENQLLNCQLLPLPRVAPRVPQMALWSLHRISWLIAQLVFALVVSYRRILRVKKVKCKYNHKASRNSFFLNNGYALTFVCSIKLGYLSFIIAGRSVSG